ncbi:hypothetical protein GQ457_04G022830 [Hibiscus cannabinus]
MISNISLSFAEFVNTVESIEAAFKSGKLKTMESSQRFQKRKDNEVNIVSTHKPRNVVITPKSASTSSHESNRRYMKGKKEETFTPIPMTYGELYPKLVEADLVRPYHLIPMQPPYPSWYDPKAQCEYHVGITGHYIDNCKAFKKVVQNLINTGVLKIDSPNVAANHLPNHGEQGVNAIEEECLGKTLESVDEVRSPLSWVYKQLRGAGLIIRDVEFDNKSGEEFCEYHQERGHKIQHCEDFKKLIQKMIDNKEIEFFIEV